MREMYLMQGLPGSGKSTVARRIQDRDPIGQAVIVSADTFPGLYTFDPAGKVVGFNPTLLGKAHGACLRNAIQAIQDGASTVIVDNTNLTALELAPYVAVAQAFGLAPIILRVECDADQAFARNTHGVPEAAHKRMRETLREYRPAPHWQFIPGYTFDSVRGD